MSIIISSKLHERNTISLNLWPKNILCEFSLPSAPAPRLAVRRGLRPEGRGRLPPPLPGGGVLVHGGADQVLVVAVAGHRARVVLGHRRGVAVDGGRRNKVVLVALAVAMAVAVVVMVVALVVAAR